MTTAGVPTLRPLSIPRLLDQTVRLYRRNFWKFIGFAAVVQVPVSLVGLLATAGPLMASDSLGEGSFLLTLAGAALSAFFNFILVDGLATAAVATVAAGGYLRSPTSFSEAIRQVGRQFWRLLGTLLLALVFLLAVFLWAIVPCLGWLTGVGMTVFFSQVILPLIAPVVVLERRGGPGALRRAWDLTRRNFWRALAFVALLYLFQQFVVAGPSLLLNAVLTYVLLVGSSFQAVAPLLIIVVPALGGLLLNLLYLPLRLSGNALLYFDLRARSEGLDLDLQAQESLGNPLEPSHLAALSPPPGRGWMLSWADVGYFALITIIIGGLCNVVYVLAVGLSTLPFLLLGG